MDNFINKNNYELFAEEYLTNELPPQDLDAFELFLKTDSSIKEELEMIRKISLPNNENSEIFNKSRLYKRRSIGYIWRSAAAALLLFAAALLLWHNIPSEKTALVLKENVTFPSLFFAEHSGIEIFEISSPSEPEISASSVPLEIKSSPAPVLQPAEPLIKTILRSTPVDAIKLLPDLEIKDFDKKNNLLVHYSVEESIYPEENKSGILNIKNKNVNVEIIHPSVKEIKDQIKTFLALN